MKKLNTILVSSVIKNKNWKKVINFAKVEKGGIKID